MSLSEKEFQQQVTDFASLMGWDWYHTHDSRHSRAGFPDLVLWHPVRGLTLFIELKTDGGAPSRRRAVSADPERVMLGLRRAGNDVQVWRPRNWAIIEAILKGEAKTPPSTAIGDDWRSSTR